MNRGTRALTVAVVVTAACLAPAAARAQGRGGAAWTTTGGDAQRTAWVKADPRISRDALQKPGSFQLLWKTKLDNQPRQLESLTQPLLLPNIISYKGFKALAFLGGSSDTVFSLDYDLSKTFWKVKLNTWPVRNTTATCPGALTTISRATPTNLPTPAAAPAPAGGGPRGGNLNIYVVASDGEVHTLNAQTGDDLTPPVKLLPPGAKAAGAIFLDPMLYVATADNCGGAPNGVHAIDLSSPEKTISRWETKGGSVAGSAGPTLGTDGSLYVATADGDYSETTFSDAVVALDPKTLKAKDWFTPGKSAFTSSPVAFEHKGKHLIAAANQDGRLYLLDAAPLGGADHKTALGKSAPAADARDFGAGALATFTDAESARWILAPSKNGIAAFKLVEQNGALTLQPGWTSREIASPLPPAVVNGVVFAVAGGDRSKPAVLYALDAATGKELWNSGTTMTSFVHGVAPSAGDGQVYVVTHDSTVYAFGIPLER